MSAEANPCISCGACCARFQVAFSAREKVPSRFHYPLGPGERALKTVTDSAGRPRCVALQGELGTFVSCGIYEYRPSPCRAFRYSYEDGGPREERCDRARAAIGLPPLTREEALGEPSSAPPVVKSIT